MRLIDADKLMYFTLGEDEKALTFVPAEFIKGTETVEAIPIEWIKKWAKDGEYTDDYKNIIARPVIRHMIADWRKENESSINN